MRLPGLIAITLTITVSLAVGIYWYRGYLTPFLPAPAGQSDTSFIQVPEGFSVSLYAVNVEGARSMVRSDNGILFVGSRSAGKLYALRDTNNDQVIDQRYLLGEGMNMPNGVALRDGDLYVAEVNRILKYPDIEHQLDNPPDPIVIRDDYPDDTHHGWKFIAFGPDGWLYVPVGAPCNICNPEPPYASITHINLDSGEREIFARGVRNTVGFDWHPQTGELWFTDNGRDWLGDDQPPDELNHASRQGMHFGYPFCHGRDVIDPEYGAEDSCERYESAAQPLGPHVAALGMRFYTGRQFPAHYRNGIFIAEHGSWNRSTPIGYRITFVRLEDNRPVSYEVFAEGWLDEETGRASGRPVDVLVMPDGSLLVSDDKAGRIYRIAYLDKS